MIGGLASLLIVGTTAVVSLLASRRWPRQWAQALVWLLALQNVLAITLWKLTGSGPAAKTLLYGKEAMVAGALVACIPLIVVKARTRSLPLPIWFSVGLVLVASAYVPLSFVHHEPLEQVARGYRSIVFPVGLLMIGACLRFAASTTIGLRHATLMVAVVLGASALIERTLVPTSFWMGIGLDRFWVDVKGESPLMLNGGLPWNFFADVSGTSMRRAVGFMSDPLGLSYALLLPLGLAFSELAESHRDWAKSQLPMLAIAAALVGIAFSLSRLPILIAGVVIAVTPAMVARYQMQGKHVFKVAAIGLAALIFVVGLSLATAPRMAPTQLQPHPSGPLAPTGAVVKPANGSTEAHVGALLEGSRTRALVFGTGLGTVGTLSAAFINSPNRQSYENVYFDTAGQIGLIGGVLLLAVLLSACWTLLRHIRPDTELRPWRAAVTVVMLLLTGAGLFSGQLLVITSLGPMWLFAGTLLGSVGQQQAQLTELRLDRA